MPALGSRSVMGCPCLHTAATARVRHTRAGAVPSPQQSPRDYLETALMPTAGTGPAIEEKNRVSLGCGRARRAGGGRGCVRCG